MPKVLISYSHEDRAHEARVRDLADELCARGIDCRIDQDLDGSPPEGWTKWMERQIEDWADVVLVACTETYRRRWKGEEVPGTGLGVIFESTIIVRNLYRTGMVNPGRFIPIVFDAADIETVITPLYDQNIYCVADAEQLDELVAYLLRRDREATPHRTSPPTPSFGWTELRRACIEISERRTASVDAVHRGIYQERQGLAATVDSFLTSPSRALVVLGRSGVGKSTFLASLAHRAAHAEDDGIVPLIYDGLYLDRDNDIDTAVGRDLRQRFPHLPIRDEPWSMLDRLVDFEGRTVLLAVDALNESRHPRALLTRLDELVRQPWPWLRILITSRPETWNVIRRGLHLAERWYFDHAGTGDVIASRYGPTVRLGGLVGEELEAAYDRYRRVFDLQTPFDELPNALASQLEDPLALRLVAETCGGGAVRMDAETIFNDYLDRLVDSSRLEPVDLRLLEQQVVPRFLAGDEPRNELDDADVEAMGGASLMRPPGVPGRTDPSLLALIDAGILQAPGPGRRRRLRFGHERFYDVLVGRHLATRLADAGDDPLTAWQDSIASTSGHPFLWSAVRNALASHLRTDDAPLTVLLEQGDGRTERMVAEALVQLGMHTAGGEHAAVVEERLERLLEGPARRGWPWRRRPTTSPRPARRVAFEAASKLARETVLVRGLDDADPAAIRWSYHLARQDLDAGLALLDGLESKAVGKLLPRLGPLRSLVMLSLLVLFDLEPDDAVNRGQLLVRWRRVMGRLLRLREDGGSGGRFRRDWLVKVLLRVCLALLYQFPSGNTWNSRDLRRSLPLSQEDRERSRTLVAVCLEPSDLEGAQAALTAALGSRNVFVDRLFVVTVILYASRFPDRVTPMLDRLAERVADAENRSGFLDSLCFAIGIVLDDDTVPTPTALFELFVRLIQRYGDYYRQPRLPGFYRDYSLHDYLAGYVLIAERRGEPWEGFVVERVATARTDQDELFFRRLLRTELPILAVESNAPQLALAVLD
ncbi:MAG: TIR domain-containing protein, partial [Acidobacteriota bacterium]